MANRQYSSSMIMMITIALAVVLVLVIWPLSMIGKGGDTAAVGGDEAELRIQPVARVEMQKAQAKSDGTTARRRHRLQHHLHGLPCHRRCRGAEGRRQGGVGAAHRDRHGVAMIKSATNGKGAMPPKGGAARPHRRRGGGRRRTLGEHGEIAATSPRYGHPDKRGAGLQKSGSPFACHRAVAQRAVEPGGAARRYWTGQDVVCPRAWAAASGQ